ncbi:MAG: 3-oxoacyl-[acyl-carrier-protein] reductase [Calditrichaeota bacterium]|nr:MAG: 3-oxoacyl-[acyl-carrier-protein] reductase [Calditrichota bacterium]MBL1203780.1 3-oxoacyl-[acyl-carrier-protein] reductase [Calditrichota bacterium]NOG43610.1 3-oxoacyl-[acyl-carrier-protein] reductase [Calditrichota bacterium]
MEFTDKVVVVTGSSRGIGKEIALGFAKSGATVVISGRNIESLQGVEKEIGETGAKSLAVAADVGKVEDATNLIKQTLETFGKIDVLVNNAGITRDNLLLRLSEDDWDSVLNTNLKGAFNCLKACTKPMMKQRGGVIINITSVVGVIGNAGQVNYSASKAGMIGLTKSSAKELASRNIRVNAVAPGFIETDMTENLPEKAKEELINSIPLSKLGSAQDVAELVLFLSSNKAKYITGQTVNVDGGMVI